MYEYTEVMVVRTGTCSLVVQRRERRIGYRHLGEPLGWRLLVEDPSEGRRYPYYADFSDDLQHVVRLFNNEVILALRRGEG